VLALALRLKPSYRADPATAKNEHVVMVEMSTLPAADIRGSGNVHPTDQGYADMATIWYSAIKGYLP